MVHVLSGQTMIERGMAMKKSTYLKNVKHVVSVTMAGLLAISGMLTGGITTNAEVGRGIQTGKENEMLPEEDAKKIASLHEPISDEGQESVDYSYVYFGRYPQEELPEEAVTREIYEAKYEKTSTVLGTGEASQYLSNDEYGIMPIWTIAPPDPLAPKDEKTARIGEDLYQRVPDVYRRNHYYKYEPICWRVIALEGNQALLVSDQILDREVYLDNKTEDWKDTSLRHWLNGYTEESSGFYYKAFTEGEANAIISKNVTSTEYKDKVSILSCQEWEQLAGMDQPYELVAKTTGYSRRCGMRIDETTKNGCYWVRNNQEELHGDKAAYIDENGVYCEGGSSGNSSARQTSWMEDEEIGVRPAIVLDLTKTSVWCTEEEMENGKVPSREEKQVYEEYGKIGDDVYYRIKDREMYVVGNGKIHDESLGGFSYERRWRVSKLTIGNHITEIGTGAFASFAQMKRLIMSNSITTAGERAFAGCSSLRNIQFSKNLKKLWKNAFDTTQWYNDQLAEHGMVVINGIFIESAGPLPTTPEAVEPGDVNLNGDVELDDAKMVLRTALKLETLTGTALEAADVDKDGEVTLKDANVVLQMSLKLVSEVLPDEDLIEAEKVEKYERELYEEIIDQYEMQTMWTPYILDAEVTPVAYQMK